MIMMRMMLSEILLRMVTVQPRIWIKMAVRPCKNNQIINPSSQELRGSYPGRHWPECHQIFIVVISRVLPASLYLTLLCSSPLRTNNFSSVFMRGRNLLEQKIKRNLSFQSLDRETQFLLILELSYLIALNESLACFPGVLLSCERSFAVENR